MKYLFHASIIICVIILAACSSGTSALIDTATHIFRPGGPVLAKIQLNPNFQYLRVTSAGREILLVLGYTDRHFQGPIEVWYSAEKEVLRFQNGRLVGAVGLVSEWRTVELQELPSWAALAKQQQQSSFFNLLHHDHHHHDNYPVIPGWAML